MHPEAKRLNDLSERIIGAAIDVHRVLSPGLLESAYEACLYYELTKRGLLVERQKPVDSVHEAQLLSYLKLSKKKLGLLLNFNVKLIARDGIRRRVNGFPEG